jgi:dynein heavy chain
VTVQPNWEPTSVGYLRPEPHLYNCPIYLNTFRGPTYVFAATLKTVDPASKWALAAVAIMMQLDD